MCDGDVEGELDVLEITSRLIHTRFSFRFPFDTFQI